MFEWLRRWWRDGSRLIFRFHDGTRWRWVDPVRTFALIDDACPQLDELLAVLREKPPSLPVPGPVGTDLRQQQKAATEKVVAVARAAFGVVPLSDAGGRPAGLTEAETIGLLTDFLEYMDALAEDARPLPSWPSRESPSPAASPAPRSPDSSAPAA